MNTVPPISFPWSQGYNVASPIWKVDNYSAFNGYPIPELDSPGIIELNYNPELLYGKSTSRLRLAIYNKMNGRWTVLPHNTVLNRTQQTLANTTRKFG